MNGTLRFYDLFIQKNETNFYIYFFFKIKMTTNALADTNVQPYALADVLTDAMPVITKENVTDLVELYFASQHITEHCSAYTKYGMLFKNIGDYKHFTGTVYKRYTDHFHVFWAIRLLTEPAKYDSDDIEFHAKKNPIYAEINTEEDENNQIGLLRKAIQAYQAKMKGKDAKHEEAKHEEAKHEEAMHEEAKHIKANHLKQMILIGSKL
jgi:hypothetical protein